MSDPQPADEGSEPPARKVDRDQETVEELVDRLRATGIDEEQIEMEVEMKFQSYAQQAVQRLQADRKARHTLQG